MGRFTQIPQDTFDALQMDAGVLLTEFDPTDADTLDNSKIICATTGGIQVSCTPEYSDLAEDVDNAPVNVKEFKHLDSWTCTLSTTSLGTSAELIRLALGAADVTAASGLIVPRKDLAQTDFADIWWVGDKANGGLVACKIINALSTGGFSLQTTKNGKGTIDIELTGHVSLNDQNKMPMEFYSIDPEPYTVTFNSNGGSAVASQTVIKGGKVTKPTNPTKNGYNFAGWLDANDEAWDFANDTVSAAMTLHATWIEAT